MISGSQCRAGCALVEISRGKLAARILQSARPSRSPPSPSSCWRSRKHWRGEFRRHLRHGRRGRGCVGPLQSAQRRCSPDQSRIPSWSLDHTISSACRGERKRSRGPIGSHRKARSNVAQFGQRQKTVENRGLVGGHVANDDLDQKVHVPGDEMTGDHLRHGEKHLDEAVFARSGVATDANSGEHRQAKTHCGAVHDRPIAFDRAGFLQQFNPSRTGRWRQANPLG